MSVWGKPLMVGAQYGVATGKPAVFSSRGGNLGGLTAQIIPSQLGSGDPSPNNIRPVVPYLGTIVSNGGTNIYDPAQNPIEQGSISSSTGQDGSSDTRIRTNGYIPVTGGADYAINCNISRVYCHFYNSAKSFISGKSVGWVDTPYVVTVPSNAAYMRLVFCYYSGNIRPAELLWMTIVQGANIVRWRSAYGLVAGAYVDIQSGSITPEYMYVRLTGSENSWISYGSGAKTVYRLTLSDVDATNAYQAEYGCSHLPSTYVTSSTESIGYYAFDNPAKLQFRPNLTDFPSLSSWTNYLAAQVNAGTPVTCYFRIPPEARTTVSLTPLQLQALTGAYSLWADCGNLTVRYPQNSMIYMS